MTLTAFHGTSEDFDEFVPGDIIPGNWFTPSESHASSFGARLIRVTLTFKHPLVIDATEQEFPTGWAGDYALATYIRDAKTERDIDGVIISGWEGPDVCYIALDPTTITIQD